jgi:hypothetical protein
VRRMWRKGALRPRMNGKSPFHPIQSYRGTYDGSLVWIKRGFPMRMQQALRRWHCRHKRRGLPRDQSIFFRSI